MCFQTLQQGKNVWMKGCEMLRVWLLLDAEIKQWLPGETVKPQLARIRRRVRPIGPFQRRTLPRSQSRHTRMWHLMTVARRRSASLLRFPLVRTWRRNTWLWHPAPPLNCAAIRKKINKHLPPPSVNRRLRLGGSVGMSDSGWNSPLQINHLHGVSLRQHYETPQLIFCSWFVPAWERDESKTNQLARRGGGFSPG